MGETRNNTLSACLHFDDELEGYLEGEPRPFVSSHSRDCPSCGALLSDLLQIREAVRTLPMEEPSPALRAGVWARLEAEGVFTLPACRQFGNELEAYLEGEPRPFIVTHARECAHCGTTLADLQAIRQAARELPSEEPSPTLWVRLQGQLQAEGALTRAACSEFDAELEAFLEGEARPFVLAHSRDCARCDAVLADLQAVQQAARALPQEEPSRVVWANVRALLEADGVFGSPVAGWRQILNWRLAPQAAPLGVLAGLVFLAFAVSFPSSSLQRWGSTGSAASSRSADQMASMLPGSDDAAVAHVVSDLESSFRANESSMAPDLRATYEKSLVSLDGAIRECLDSLRNEPRSTLAHDYLLAAYTRKAEVLSSALEFEGR